MRSRLIICAVATVLAAASPAYVEAHHKCPPHCATPTPTPTPTPTATPTATPTPTPTPPPSTSFADEFDGLTVDTSKWLVTDVCDNWGSLSCNQARNVTLDGAGHLVVTVRKEPVTDIYGKTGTWSSGRLESATWRQVYGTWEASIKIPAGRGFWPSFWTTGEGAWPDTGEIDVMEILGHNVTKAYCNVHYSAGGVDAETGPASYITPVGEPTLADAFHVYKAVWDTFGTTFLVDGNLCASWSRTWSPEFPGQNVMVGIAVGGGWPGPSDSTTPLEAQMLVDYVRVSP